MYTIYDSSGAEIEEWATNSIIDSNEIFANINIKA